MLHAFGQTPGAQEEDIGKIADTIEEKVVNLHAKKTALAEDILAAGASSLSAEAMLDLLKG